MGNGDERPERRTNLTGETRRRRNDTAAKPNLGSNSAKKSRTNAFIFIHNARYCGRSKETELLNVIIEFLFINKLYKTSHRYWQFFFFHRYSRTNDTSIWTFVICIVFYDFVSALRKLRSSIRRGGGWISPYSV